MPKPIQSDIRYQNDQCRVNAAEIGNQGLVEQNLYQKPIDGKVNSREMEIGPFDILKVERNPLPKTDQGKVNAHDFGNQGL